MTKATGAQLIWLLRLFLRQRIANGPKRCTACPLLPLHCLGLGMIRMEIFLGFRPPCTTGHVFANAFLFQQQPFSKQKHLAPRLLRMGDCQMIV
jgi:hypothetical protein